METRETIDGAGQGWSVPRVLGDLREAGETGKRQWEEILAGWRTQLQERPALAQLLEQAKVQLGEAAEKVGEAAAKVRQAQPVVQAQARGTDLLRQVLARVRDGATALETRLGAPAKAV